MQGMLRPVPPPDGDDHDAGGDRILTSVGVPTDAFAGHPGVVDAAGAHVPDITRGDPGSRRPARRCPPR